MRHPTELQHLVEPSSHLQQFQTLSPSLCFMTLCAAELRTTERVTSQGRIDRIVVCKVLPVPRPKTIPQVIPSRTEWS